MKLRALRTLLISMMGLFSIGMVVKNSGSSMIPYYASQRSVEFSFSKQTIIATVEYSQTPKNTTRLIHQTKRPS